MHMIAIEAHRDLFDDEHPDTAQSHNNLALLNTGDRSWARRHLEKSLAGFKALGPNFSNDLEAVAQNYCAFLRDECEIQLAEVIANRVQQVHGTTAAAR
jgi:hypothetical protein